ncbi:MAG: glycosyltransferase family 4 protein [Gaiellaceae bacterium]
MARMVPPAAAAGSDQPSGRDSGSFDAFICYRESPQRRAALAAELGSPERYLLFGLDELAGRGVHVQHNLERQRAPTWARLADNVLNRLVRRGGGYGGDFYSVLPSLRRLNAADVVLSTVDTVGLPLVLLRRAGLVRRPLVYVSIGLPERLGKLRGAGAARGYAAALRRVTSIVAYSEHEAALLREVVGEDPAAPPVTFVPFGVDVDRFQPLPGAEQDFDVVSIGADPHRDFPLLVRIAARHPELRFRIVGGAVGVRDLGPLPANVQVEVDIPLPEMRDHLARSRVVALPVRANSYSGATTVLLQAMAMGKPVVVSRTPAIATGYGLADGENCLLVEPGDEIAFERALLSVLADDTWAAALGAAARRLVQAELSWARYVDAIHAALAASVARH